MEKSRKGIENKISSQEKKMNAKDYATKVPEAVQAADKEKIERYSSVCESFLIPFFQSTNRAIGDG